MDGNSRTSQADVLRRIAGRILRVARIMRDDRSRVVLVEMARDFTLEANQLDANTIETKRTVGAERLH
jgi:hypothetical protein